MDGRSPQRFYLADPSLEALSDCFAAVDGVRLPLHSQVLSTQSGVLRELFLAQAEGGLADEGPFDLSTAFQGVSAWEAACLLRLVYHPQDTCPAYFAALAAGGQLSGVAALAHKWDVARPLAAIERYLEGVTSYCETSLPGLLIAMQLAQRCRFDGVEARCLDALAAKLAAAAAASPQRCQAMWEAALVALDGVCLARLLCRTLAVCHPNLGAPGCSVGATSSAAAESTAASASSASRQLLDEVASALPQQHNHHHHQQQQWQQEPRGQGRQVKRQRVEIGQHEQPAQQAQQAEAGGIHEVRHACGGGFTWRLHSFSATQHSPQALRSPWVRLAGLDWRLVVHPRGAGAGKDTHLSVHLELCRAAAAGRAGASGLLSCSIAAVPQGDAPAASPSAADAEPGFQQHSAALAVPIVLSPDAPSMWGFERFISLDQLSAPGQHLLAGDCLVLQVALAVGGSIVAA